MNVYAKFRCALLHIKKALAIFGELITRRTTTRVVFGTRLPGPKIAAVMVAVVVVTKGLKATNTSQ